MQKGKAQGMASKIERGRFAGKAKLYSVSGATLTYISDIYADAGTTVLSDGVASAAFSPDGSKLVLGGGFTGNAKLYSIFGTTLTYISDIYADAETTALSDVVLSAAFSPDGSKLVLGGWFTGFAKLYSVSVSVSGTTVSYISDIYTEAGITVLSCPYRDWETDRKSTRLNSSHSGESRMPSSA